MKISVLIPAYGEEAWRVLAEERARPSVESQAAYEVLTRYEAQGTIASTRNALAEEAAGDWLLFLDADDTLRHDFIRRVIDSYQPNGSLTLYTPSVSYVKNGRAMPPKFWPECDFRTGNWLIIGTLVHRDLFHRVGGFREGEPHGLEDWSLWARCSQAGATVIKVPPAVYFAHDDPNSKHHQLQRNRQAYMVEYHRVRESLWGA